MDFLSFLGLREGADERAVKRAYATQLKKTRPDEDPEGFQKLHQAYVEALAWAKQQKLEDQYISESGPIDANSEATRKLFTSQPEEAEGDLAKEHDQAPSIQTIIDGVPVEVTVIEENIEPIADKSESSTDTFDEELEGEIYQTISLEDLVSRVLEEAADKNAGAFQIWLDDALLQLPFDAKPHLAVELVHKISNDESVVSPEQFNVILKSFNLMDVNSPIDPVFLSQMREEIRVQSRIAKDQAKFTKLFDPNDRSQMCKHMAWAGCGGYRPSSTRIYMAVLTNPIADKLVFFMRFIPFFAGSIMTFIVNIDEGDTTLLTPHIKQKTLRKWRKAYDSPVVTAWFYPLIPIVFLAFVGWFGDFVQISATSHNTVQTSTPSHNIASIYSKRCKRYRETETLNSTKRAKKDCGKALMLNPNDLDAEFSMALINQFDNKKERALEGYNRVLIADPDHVPSLNNRIMIYRYQEKLNRAYKDAIHLIKLTPDDPNAINLLGLVYLSQKKFRTAVRTFNEAIVKAPSETMYLDNAGLAALRSRQYAKAIKFYGKSIEIDDSDQSTLARRGVAYFRLREYQPALEDLNKAVQLNPNYDYAVTFRGKVHLAMKNYQLAVNDFQSVLEMKPWDDKTKTLLLEAQRGGK